MKDEKAFIRSLIQFFLNHLNEPKLLFEVYSLLYQLGVDIFELYERYGGERSTLWEFVDYISFDPIEYPSNYPVPQLEEDVVKDLKTFLERTDS